uniref:Uncharacterized protein n=1 Tax=Pipistrellus kuhlii TaxID=59472 RepID=A0A7J7WDI9_PIPKU|nr:hypothetical protein mPipKuh1_008088 [Pipistrellus kuhlii]
MCQLTASLRDRGHVPGVCRVPGRVLRSGHERFPRFSRLACQPHAEGVRELCRPLPLECITALHVCFPESQLCSPPQEAMQTLEGDASRLCRELGPLEHARRSNIPARDGRSPTASPADVFLHLWSCPWSRRQTSPVSLLGVASGPSRTPLRPPRSVGLAL